MGRRNKFKKASTADNSVVAVPADVTSDEKDNDLLEDLFMELSSRDAVEQPPKAPEDNPNVEERPQEVKPKQSAKRRFLVRQAKKAAVLMKQRPKEDPASEARRRQEILQEEEAIKRICVNLGVYVYEVNADGHCLYSAVADQLAVLSILPPEQATYMTTRLAASIYIWTHPLDFLPFIPHDEPASSGTGVMSPQAFERYCAAVRYTAVWGGELEILALSRAYDVPIHVVQGTSPPVVVHDPAGEPMEHDTSRKVVRISYHRKRYGLGEHYNSLRPTLPLVTANPSQVFDAASS